MTADHESDPGFKVTVKDVYTEVRDVKTMLDERLRKVESQIAAQWVVVAIIVAAIGGLLVRSITMTI